MDANTIRLFSSKKTDEYGTPQALFDELNKEFHFNLDAAASKENTKCKEFYSIENNSLNCHWWGNVWCNPPYSKIKQFLAKGTEEIICGNAQLIVFLTFANTDTAWFWDHCYQKPNVEIRFIKGRLKFTGVENKANSAMRPSMLVIMRKH